MKESDFKANVILASRPSTGGPDLITVHCRYPRFIHAEVMTHRVFSRNARSSRAVPTKKLMAEEIFIPHFLKNKTGMQATEEFDPKTLKEIQEAWEDFAYKTQEFQQYLVDKGVHKQWSNRPGEWFGYIDTLITSTEWSNWFALRDHEAAAPEIRCLAQRMDAEFQRALQENTLGFQILAPGQWHIPYVSDEESEKIFDDITGEGGFGPREVEETLNQSLKLSVARCARISYAPFDGNGSLEKEIERHDMLKNANPIHASPFEHQAQVVLDGWSEEHQYYIPSNLAYPWLQYRKVIGE